MANFAELDENNKVINVIVIDNSILLDKDGNESEQKGIEFLSDLYGHANWKQTSFNNNFRKNYAGIGCYFNEEKNAFIYPKPEGYNSFILNEDTCIYEPPIEKPDDSVIRYYWNENELAWIADTRFKRNIYDNSWEFV